jgi:hypothetical protein
MTRFDGIPVQQVPMKQIADLLNSTPKDGKLSARHSTVPEFFNDSAYYHNGKLLFIHRHTQGEFYTPTQEWSDTWDRVSSPTYANHERAVTRSERAMRRNVHN